MKKCPYCAEEIQDEAIKCKHCGEFLTESGKVCNKKSPVMYKCLVRNKMDIKNEFLNKIITTTSIKKLLLKSSVVYLRLSPTETENDIKKHFEKTNRELISFSKVDSQREEDRQSTKSVGGGLILIGILIAIIYFPLGIIIALIGFVVYIVGLIR